MAYALQHGLATGAARKRTSRKETPVSLGITWLDALLWGVLTFSILIVLHEGGHFLAARAFGVRVHEFMVGLPGPALSFVSKRSGTRFGVTAVPLGGYVRIAGMDYGPEDALLGRAVAVVADAGTLWVSDLASELEVDLSRASTIAVTLADWGVLETLDDDGAHLRSLVARAEGEDDAALASRTRSQTYRGLSTLQRVTLLSAGVLVNIVAAYLVLVVVIATAGDAVGTSTVAEATRGAAAAGIVAGDRIVSVDGVEVADFEQLLAEVTSHEPGERVTVRLARDGAELDLPVELSGITEGGETRAVMGITSKLAYGPVPLGRSFVAAGRMVLLVCMAIIAFFNPDTFQEAVSGARSVIGASEEIAKAVKAGPVDYAWLVALLSLSLGLMNVLPIPPLDGGKVLIEIVERIIGKPIRREISLAVTAVGALVLFSLIGYLMYADVARLVTG